MVKAWAGSGWKDEISKEGNLCIYSRKGGKDSWWDGDWPPIKIRILTEDEFQELLRKALHENPIGYR